MLDAQFLESYDQIIFDLDDTLIYEKDYLFAAYLNIAETLGNSNEEVINMYSYLRNNFVLGNRSRLFNDFINEFGLPNSHLNIMIQLLRSVKINGGLQITVEGKQILQILKFEKREYSIITNGNPIQQSNKINQILWGENPRPNSVVYANEFEPKPSPKSYFMVQGITGGKALYIGDSEVDKDFANNAGMGFYQINSCMK
jgi:phosphoglycolate phosphatase-like HAD superfamily hydrolase